MESLCCSASLRVLYLCSVCAVILIIGASLRHH
jgi:hypothetical protein